MLFTPPILSHPSQHIMQVLGKSLFDLQDPWMSYITNGLKAKELLLKDKDYIVRGDDIAIVDRFSGRVLEGRKYSDGLQQSIQTKEGLPCSSQSQVIATITYQSLFRLFYKLSGMTGTALTDFKVHDGQPPDPIIIMHAFAHTHSQTTQNHTGLHRHVRPTCGGHPHRAAQRPAGLPRRHFSVQGGQAAGHAPGDAPRAQDGAAHPGGHHER